jgi:hypothetical protein
VVSILAVGFVSELHAQGWGMRRLEVSLTRKLPSAITFTGSTVKIRVEATSQGQVPRQVADIFRARLTAEMFKDSRIVEEKTSPDAIIETTINEFSTTTKPGQRTNLDLKTGRNIPFHTRVVSGQVTVSYRTLDGRNKNGMDAGNLRFDVEQEFMPTGEPYRELFKKTKEPFKRLPTAPEVQEYLIDGIVMEVTKRLVTVDESIKVPLPRGKLEAASKLGVAARWGAMLEAVERMPPFPEPANEAFRQYAIAVANEALAYQESDRGRSQDLLAKAALGYKKAIQANAGEDVFHTAQNRMANYVGPSSPTGTAGLAERETSRSVPSAPSALRNLDVIKFAQEKFSEDFMLESIASAPGVEFDLSTDSLVELKRAGVSERVIKTMRDRMAKGTTKRAPEN